jgi:hypothetical protein
MGGLRRCHVSCDSEPRPASTVDSGVAACRIALDSTSPHRGEGGSGADTHHMALRGLWAMRIKNNPGYVASLERYRGMRVC